jgi:hypothetical protein
VSPCSPWLSRVQAELERLERLGHRMWLLELMAELKRLQRERECWKMAKQCYEECLKLYNMLKRGEKDR